MTEIICLAISRETVMRYIDLFKRCKFEVVGVHTETLAMVRAFDHLNRRDGDTNVTTLIVDLGWGGTRIAITHGKQLTFARYVPIGGKHFDQLICSTVHCDTNSARAHRLTLQQQFDVAVNAAGENRAVQFTAALEQPGLAVVRGAAAAAETTREALAVDSVTVERRTGAVPRELASAVPSKPLSKPQVDVNFSELLDTITDELSMSLRYHQSLFRGRAIDRAIFVGGESRQAWLCQHIGKTLRVPGQLGDPLARYSGASVSETPGLTLGKPQPGWAVACGLCNAPTDL